VLPVAGTWVTGDAGREADEGCPLGLEAVITAWLAEGDELGWEVCKVATVMSFLVVFELPGLVIISAAIPMMNSDTRMAGQGLPFFSTT